MKATQQLMNEHEVILKMLEILGAATEKLENNEDVNTQDMESMIDFLRVFADKCHHKKEEALLFPALEKKGISNQSGPIGVMLNEHVQGRKFIMDMAEGIIIYKTDKLKGARKIAENALGYINLLTQHISKENNILFKMADNVLSPLDQQELLIQFDEAEEKELGPDVHKKYQELVNKLSVVYLK